MQNTKPKKGALALKGLRSVAPGQTPPHKQGPPVDPTKILRDAIKAKQIEALALQAGME